MEVGVQPPSPVNSNPADLTRVFTKKRKKEEVKLMTDDASLKHKQRRSNIRTGSAAYFCIIGFLVIFLCIVAPPAAPRSGRVKFVFIYRTSYVGLTSSQHLATVIRYADRVNQHFRASRRHQAENFTSFITRLIRLWHNMSSGFQRGEGIFETRYYVILHVFYVISFFSSPLKLGTLHEYTCLTEARRLSPP